MTSATLRKTIGWKVGVKQELLNNKHHIWEQAQGSLPTLLCCMMLGNNMDIGYHRCGQCGHVNSECGQVIPYGV